MLKLSIPLPRLIGPADVIAADSALGLLARLPGRCAALVATPRTAKRRDVQAVLDHTTGPSITHVIPSWTGEPTLDELGGTLKALEELGPDWLVAIGGGSVIDGTKLCWARYEHPHVGTDRLSLPFALPPLRRRARFVAVPTTAGTGSEVSSSALFEDEELGAKVAVVTHDFQPDLVILDATLTQSLPPEPTLMSGLDALAHAIEGYVSTQANPMVDGLAEQAVRVLLRDLPQLAGIPDDLEARRRVQIAAFYAGYVQNLRLVGPAHAVAHRLGALGVPHGLASGLLLPEAIVHNAHDTQVRAAYDRLAEATGRGSTEALIDGLRELPNRFDLPAKLSGWPGVDTAPDGAAFEQIARGAADDPMLARFFPVPLSADDARAMLDAVW